MDSQRAIDRGFNGNTAVYSIIKKDAKKFGSIPRIVESKSQEGKAMDDSKPLNNALSALLNRPNEYQGQDAFLTLVRAFYKTCGEVFIWLNRGDTDTLVADELVQLSDEQQAKKPVLEMYVLPPNRMIVVPDPDNLFGVYGYILESNIRIPIRKVDIIHWKDVNECWDAVSRTHLRGYSALAAGFKTLEANNSASDASVRMYQNSGAKGALVNKNMAQMNPKQESELRAVIDGKVNNRDLSYSTKNAIAAFQGEWDYLNFGLTSVDMELLEGKDYSMKELCFLLGMPFEFFDPHTPFAEKQIGQKSWLLNEIIPDCKQLDGEMNRVLPKAFGMEGKAVICTDTEAMPELQEDKKTMLEWMMKAPMKVDEIREAIGYDKLGGEEGEMIIIPSGFQNLEDLNGDNADEIMQELYSANGTANRSNGKVPVPKNGQGAKL